MEDPRIRKLARFLIQGAVELQKDEKILIELHGSETGLMKALVQEAYAVGGKPFIHIFDYAVEGALVQGADEAHMAEIAAYELERMKDMDAYIDIRATTNISMWHNVSDEAQRRYRQYYWGPIHLSQRCNHTKWSVLRFPNDAMAQLAGVSTEEYLSLIHILRSQRWPPSIPSRRLLPWRRRWMSGLPRAARTCSAPRWT